MQSDNIVCKNRVQSIEQKIVCKTECKAIEQNIVCKTECNLDWKWRKRILWREDAL